MTPKEICTHKDIYLRATDDKGDGERLKVPVTKDGKYLYPIVVKQQRDGGVHHLDLPPRLVPIVILDHAQPLTRADLPGAPHTQRADRRGVARPSVVSAACSRSRCAA